MQQEQESLPFAPKMLSRASSPGPQSAPAAPSNPADRDAFFGRIKLRLHALEERKHKAKGEWELRGCSFTPHINRSTRQQHTAGGLPFHERLYNDVSREGGREGGRGGSEGGRTRSR